MTETPAAHRFAWATFAIVMLSVLLAWADPVAGLACNALVLTVAAVWLFSQGIGASLHWVAIPLAATPAWGLAQIATGWTVYPHATWLELLSWTAHGAFCYLGFATLQNRERRESILSSLLCCATLLSAVGILQWFTAGGRVFWLFATPYDGEVMATFLNRDHYAVFVELLMPIALARALFDLRGGAKYALSAGFLYASVVTTGSRAGTAMVTLEAAALILVSLRHRGWKTGRVFALAAALVVVSTAAGWEYLWFRLNQPDLFSFRREMAYATVNMIRARPWTGFGLGTWPTAYPAFALFDPPGFFMNHAHNDWLEWFSDGGLPFLACSLTIAWAAVRLAKRNWWAFGVPVALIHAIVDFPLHKPAVAAVLFFLLGAAASTARDSVPGTKSARRRVKPRPVTIAAVLPAVIEQKASADNGQTSQF